jgi:MFS family permease
VDLSPFRHRDFRLLYAGQFVSFLGSTMSRVALPYALYQATHSTILMGLLGVIELAPSVVGGVFGGALADALDRRRLIVVCELGMAAVVLVLGLALQAAAPDYPHWGWLLGAGAALAVLNGVHRPALEALTPQLVEKHEMPALGVLASLRGNVAMIGGPALAGVLLGTWGPALVFWIDAASFLLCVAALLAMRRVPPAPRAARVSLRSIEEGLRYAAGRQELVGTYVVDIVAMTFSMPSLLFPAIADAFGSVAYLGWLHSGMALGALIAGVTSTPLLRIRRHGLAVLIAAGAWSVCMVGFGLATTFPLAFAFLVLAGYADMVSGVFRMTIWNQTVPAELRGRLAGIEMISYLSGPMLGNTQLGFLAYALGVQRAVALSSLVGICGVAACARLLPGFRGYRADAR